MLCTVFNVIFVDRICSIYAKSQVFSGGAVYQIGTFDQWQEISFLLFNMRVFQLFDIEVSIYFEMILYTNDSALIS